METSLIINGDTQYFSSGPPPEEIILQFMSNGLVVNPYDSSDYTDWNINGDSLYMDGDAYQYTVTKTELELKGLLEDVFVSPADLIIRATR